MQNVTDDTPRIQGATPGKRLAASSTPDLDRRLTLLRAKLEQSTGRRHSISEVVRIAIERLAESEGV